MTNDDLKALQREARAILKPFEAFTKLRFAAGSFVEDLETALKKLPQTGAVSGAIDELRHKAERLLAEERGVRVQQFRRVEAAYVNKAREAGKPIRELNTSWRIGPFELDLKREQSKARILYNREEVVGWKAVSAPEHLDDMEAKATAQLKKYDVAQEELADLVLKSYRRARSERARSDNQDAVPAHDFLREFRLELLRRELAGGKVGKKLKTGDFPLWALLHNLDRYRRMSANIPDSERIGFQTGSQQEQAKGMGIVLNGLDAAQEYKVFCYTIPSR